MGRNITFNHFSQLKNFQNVLLFLNFFLPKSQPLGHFIIQWPWNFLKQPSFNIFQWSYFALQPKRLLVKPQDKNYFLFRIYSYAKCDLFSEKLVPNRSFFLSKYNFKSCRTVGYEKFSKAACVFLKQWQQIFSRVVKFLIR